MSKQEKAKKEAEIICKYLLHIGATQEVIDRYVRIVEKKGLKINPRKQDFIIRHSWSVGLLDGSDAIFKPQSDLRKRIFLMFAILECTTEYSDYFLPKPRSTFYILNIMIIGFSGAIKIFSGTILQTLMRLN